METYSDEGVPSVKSSFFADLSSCCGEIDVFSLCGELDFSVIVVLEWEPMERDTALEGSGGLLGEPEVSKVAGAKGGVVGILRLLSATSGGPDIPDIDGVELPTESVRVRRLCFGLSIRPLPEND